MIRLAHLWRRLARLRVPSPEGGWRGTTKGAYRLWRTLPRGLPYLRPYKVLAIVSIGLTLLAAAAALAEPWPLAIVVDGVLSDGKVPGFISAIVGESKTAVLLFAVFAMFALSVITNGITVLTDWVNARLEQNMVLDLRSDLFRHCQSLSLAFHDQRRSGEFNARINQQAAALGSIMLAFPPMLQAALTLIGMLVIALLIDWQVTLVSLVVVPFLYWSFGLYGTRIVPRLQKVQGLEFQSLSIVHEAMQMLRVIVSFGREKHEHRKFREQGEVAVDERVKVTVWQTLFSLGVTTATAAGTSLVLGFGAWHVLRGDITLGELLVLMSYIAAAYQPLEQISSTVGSLHEQFVKLNSSMELLDTEPEVIEADDAIDMGRARGAVEFEGVSFAYTGRKDTLKNISFAVEPGQRVALVGPTGAGKTTLISLLIRFYEPASGRILIDGVDTRKLTLESLRDQISVVLQEPLLFSETIRENIRYGRLDATDEEVVAAAKAANAHDFITGLPKGYDTKLGERGASLSGGERQRVCVARAFVRNAPILILDEPTSSIDSKTEGVILDALEDLMEGRTSFMIAHRLSTVRDADLIVVLDEGEVVEQGTHDELLEQDGLFKQLHTAQNVQRRRRRGAGANGNGKPATTEASEEGRAEAVNNEVAAAPEGNGSNGQPPAADPDAAPVGAGAAASRDEAARVQSAVLDEPGAAAEQPSEDPQLRGPGAGPAAGSHDTLRTSDPASPPSAPAPDPFGHRRMGRLRARARRWARERSQ